MKIRPVRAESFHANVQTDRQTDRQTDMMASMTNKTLKIAYPLNRDCHQSAPLKQLNVAV